MFYRGATHGAWCGARTYPTTCRWCGAKVFYFCCGCGCKVFFDSLGPPWPVHNCQSPDYILAQVEVKIAQDYAERVTRRQRRREWRAPIRACPPLEGQTIEEMGFVREVGRVDVYKKFRLSPDAQLASQLLGELSDNDFWQVTVHTGDMNADQKDSYTFLIRKDDWEKIGAIRGDLLCFSALGKAMPGREPYWLCTEVYWPF